MAQLYIILQDKCMSVWNSKGFFLNLPEIDGAVAAAREMAAMEG